MIKIPIEIKDEDSDWSYIKEWYFEIEPSDYSLEFKLFSADSTSGPISEAEGYLKWDGCLNYTINNHACSAKDLFVFSYALQQIWKQGKLIKHWDDGTEYMYKFDVEEEIDVRK